MFLGDFKSSLDISGLNISKTNFVTDKDRRPLGQTSVHFCTSQLGCNEPAHEIMAQASLRILAVSPEPSLFAHVKYGSRRRV